MSVWANVFYETVAGGETRWRAMPVMIATLCVLAIAYRFYSKFLAAKVAALDDSRPTPAHTLNDGQNYHPTNRWVLFGHHFAAISGAGPLIGPVLAIQYGYLPSLLWLLIGVCLAGAVQDMLVLAASVRRGGKSLAEIARSELGPWATVVVSAAILFIVIIALAGLGIVVVKALGGEEVKLGQGWQYKLNPGVALTKEDEGGKTLYVFPRESTQQRYKETEKWVDRPETFKVEVPAGVELRPDAEGVVTLPDGCKLIVPGSSWGTFTIACTIPIALFVGLYMYKIRKGRVVEASLIGAFGVLAATVIGNFIPGSPLESWFSLSREKTILAMVIYGFVASVLPVWILLCPRDYLSSFLKIGTVALLVVGVIVANPTLKAARYEETFAKGGGPTFWGDMFPFVFICVMCGAVSGFHALVSSGTTPKMINREKDVRPIGYGAMLIEGLVGVVALIAAASLDPKLYLDMNTDQGLYSQVKDGKKPPVLDKLEQVYKRLEEAGAKDPLLRKDLSDLHRLPVVEEMVGGESLRGRTGGAVTLAVGMSLIFTEAVDSTGLMDPGAIKGFMKYWYHFAIMFEALFILTTIDTGTRIARFLLQEAAGKVNKKYGKTDWMPGAILSSLIVTGGWGLLILSGSIETIWPMFGIANQMLAVIALCLVTTLMIHNGKGRYAWVTLLPMVWVIITTTTAGYQLVTIRFPAMIGEGKVLQGYLNIGFTVFVMACVYTLLLMAVARWMAVARGVVPVRAEGNGG